jgi:hypothetical protein
VDEQGVDEQRTSRAWTSREEDKVLARSNGSQWQKTPRAEFAHPAAEALSKREAIARFAMTLQGPSTRPSAPSPDAPSEQTRASPVAGEAPVVASRLPGVLPKEAETFRRCPARKLLT